jgi:phosphatidylcholine synthase
VFAIQHIGLLPGGLIAWIVVAAVLLSSAFGFSRQDAKTTDHFFTGFPSYWNVVAFYLYVLQWPTPLAAGVVSLLAILVFVPLRYAYPSRMTELRLPTVVLGLAWGAVLLWCLIDFDPARRMPVVWSLLYPAYYVAISLYLHAKHAG